jgi:hypothetical protein
MVSLDYMGFSTYRTPPPADAPSRCPSCKHDGGSCPGCRGARPF